MKIRLPLTICLLCLVCLTGCSTVQPWERDILAKPQMSLTPDSLQDNLREHTYNSREAAAQIRAGGAGGGCGCY